MKPEPKVCEQCGLAFVPAKPWARFCSEGCRLRGFRAAKRAADPSLALRAALAAALTALRSESNVAAALAEVRREITVYAAAQARQSKRKRPARTLLERFAAAVEQGHTSASIAHAIGLADASTLSHWRNGRRALSPEREAALIDYLDKQGTE